MNINTTLAVVLGAIANFFLGFVIYGVILMDTMAANTNEFEGLMKDESGMMVAYVIGSILYAFLITWLCNKSNERTAMGGLVMGAVVSLFFAASFDIVMYFGMNLFTSTWLIIDIIAYTVMGAGTGLVIGAMLGRNKMAADPMR